jgi:hypothetical protein
VISDAKMGVEADVLPEVPKLPPLNTTILSPSAERRSRHNCPEKGNFVGYSSGHKTGVDSRLS